MLFKMARIHEIKHRTYKKKNWNVLDSWNRVI
jgi:hypothetical protein